MTATPWGDAHELRSRKLRPGPGTPRDEVAGNQRERLFGAMVIAVDKHGFEATRVADVVALSGVSRSDFYEHFTDKLDCFLAAIDTIAGIAARRILAAYEGEQGWERRLGAAAGAFVELIAEQPAAARLCLVEVYAAGPSAVGRLDRATRAVEGAVRRALAESPRHAGMPTKVVTALVGGVHKAAHTRLREGREDELTEVMPQLLEWALGYHAPPVQLSRPRRRPDRGAAPQPSADEARSRLITAMTSAAAERGYPETTIAEVANRASASLSTFYMHFDGKEEAFTAAVGRGREEARAATLAPYRDAADWPHGVRDGLDALFAYLAAEPAVATIGAIGTYAAGAQTRARGDRGASFAALLEPGFETRPSTPRLASEAIGGAIHALVYAQIQSDRTPRMRELTPTATFVALAPFVGERTACAVANEPLRRG